MILHYSVGDCCGDESCQAKRSAPVSNNYLEALIVSEVDIPFGSPGTVQVEAAGSMGMPVVRVVIRSSGIL